MRGDEEEGGRRMRTKKRDEGGRRMRTRTRKEETRMRGDEKEVRI